jgi:hypothetical protein
MPHEHAGAEDKHCCVQCKTVLLQYQTVSLQYWTVSSQYQNEPAQGMAQGPHRALRPCEHALAALAVCARPSWPALLAHAYRPAISRPPREPAGRGGARNSTLSPGHGGCGWEETAAPAGASTSMPGWRSWATGLCVEDRSIMISRPFVLLMWWSQVSLSPDRHASLTKKKHCVHDWKWGTGNLIMPLSSIEYPEHSFFFSQPIPGTLLQIVRTSPSKLIKNRVWYLSWTVCSDRRARRGHGTLYVSHF